MAGIKIGCSTRICFVLRMESESEKMPHRWAATELEMRWQIGYLGNDRRYEDLSSRTCFSGILTCLKRLAGEFPQIA